MDFPVLCELTQALPNSCCARMSSPQLQAATLIRNYYETFNAGDRVALLALLTDEIAHDINQGGTETGKAAFAAFLTRMDRCYREQVVDLVVFASEDGRVARRSFTSWANTSPLTQDCRLPAASVTVCVSVPSLICWKVASAV